jgi:hypothetical protein
VICVLYSAVPEEGLIRLPVHVADLLWLTLGSRIISTRGSLPVCEGHAMISNLLGTSCPTRGNKAIS